MVSSRLVCVEVGNLDDNEQGQNDKTQNGSRAQGT
jgi:hypothetical protein